MMNRTVRSICIAIVIGIGFLQIIGYLIHSSDIRGLGVLSAAAPLPIVFTTVKGVETFSNQFNFHITNTKGITAIIPMTPDLYSMIKGPYNRRNVFGAAIAYGPVLDSALLNTVLDHAICKGVLIDELGMDRSSMYEIHVKHTSQQDSWILRPDCHVQ